MPMYIVRNDITKMEVDAIVNPTNEWLKPGGGVDAAVHEAAGPRMTQACSRIGRLSPGCAAATKGYQLPCKYVIHTVGPQWIDGTHQEEAVLRRCYKESLMLAKKEHCKSIAFPLIAAGYNGYPAKEGMAAATKAIHCFLRDEMHETRLTPEKNMETATDVIRTFLQDEEMTVYLVVFDDFSYRLSRETFAEVQSFIDSHYASSALQQSAQHFTLADTSCSAPMQAPAPRKARSASYRFSLRDLAEKLRKMDESFSETVLRLIDEKGMTDAQCYKRANIDRKLFSKIRNPKYKPSKPTVLALAVALELNLEETRNLLEKAGFALSHSSKFDVIVEYCILNEIYDIFTINEILFSYDQSLLGSVS